MTDTVLVTGAAGFAGSHLLDALQGSPAPIVAWQHRAAPPPEHPAGVRWQAVDLLDARAVREAVAAIQPAVIYHCAGAAHVGESWNTAETTLRVNVLGTHHLLEGVRLARLTPRILIPSSALVYEPSDSPVDETHRVAPRSPYALSKLAQELVGAHARDGAPPALIARAFNHLGPRQDPSFSGASFARQIAGIEHGLAPPVLRVGNLDAERDLTDVRDTVLAYRAIAERGRPGDTYNVCSGRAVPIRQLLDLLLSHARVPIAVEVDPARYRPHDARRLVGDNTRLRTELGWAPRIPLERTAADLLAYWRTRIGAGA
ncbi:MAG: GDP-mannose 4,6-dehydratase [Acidobacteriota bacterium]|nr:GDP-mannose 4,6-dehydratase [Acidobacteriota bacterium]